MKDREHDVLSGPSFLGIEENTALLQFCCCPRLTFQTPEAEQVRTAAMIRLAVPSRTPGLPTISFAPRLEM
jgi:hypothetical protein